MILLMTLLASISAMAGAAAASEECEVPPSFLSGDAELTHVSTAVKERHRLDIAVVGTGSSALSGPTGPGSAYPARLEEALRQRLPGTEIKVTAHIRARQTTAEMAAGMKQVMTAEKPSLVLWQTGTFDAMKGIELDEFRNRLDEGVEQISSGGADIGLINMQYSPRTESILGVSAYADVMHWVAQQHGALLFDRLGIMRYWNDEGVFDLYAATKNYDMARHVHACIGRALALQIINASHLTP